MNYRVQIGHFLFDKFFYYWECSTGSRFECNKSSGCKQVYGITVQFKDLRAYGKEHVLLHEEFRTSPCTTSTRGSGAAASKSSGSATQLQVQDIQHFLKTHLLVGHTKQICFHETTIISLLPKNTLRYFRHCRQWIWKKNKKITTQI